MRISLTILITTFCLVFALAAVGTAQEADPIKFSVLAGATTPLTPGDADFGDNIGYRAGGMVTFSMYLSMMGTYDYLKVSDDFSTKKISLYGVFTLMEIWKVKLSGLAGVELDAKSYSDFDYSGFSWGAVGRLPIVSCADVYALATATTTRDAEVFGDMTLSAGLIYNF